MDEKIIIEVKCPFCGKVSKVEVNEYDFVLNEVLNLPVQQAYPYLTGTEREILISGMCVECQDKVFGGFEDVD